MSEIAIRVEGLGKQYRIGARETRYQTFREAIVGALRAPFRRREAQRELFWALQDVAFEIREGETVGLIGANGSGKSTLLKVLCRITEPTAGRAELRGRVAALLEVGTGFHPELTGRENIYLNGAILGMKRAEITRDFDQIVSFAEVERFIDTQVKHYSSGMYLRLAFAVAAHLEPEILFVDEVLAVGDLAFQKKCLARMEDVARQGRTVIFVSHNLAALERICGRAILLEKGRVAVVGKAPEVIRAYLERGAAQVAERRWDPELAPGDDVVRLRATRILDANGVVRSELTLADELSIELEFEVCEPDRKLECWFRLQDEEGGIVFVTSDCQDGTWLDRARPVGIHRTRFVIPPNLLNEGQYSIVVWITSPPDQIRFREVNALSFRTIDAESGAAPGWGGAVRPRFRWIHESGDPK
jgi:lipopolysaccharide transport system ATP-binding protein